MKLKICPICGFKLWLQDDDGNWVCKSKECMEREYLAHGRAGCEVTPLSTPQEER